MVLRAADKSAWQDDELLVVVTSQLPLSAMLAVLAVILTSVTVPVPAAPPSTILPRASNLAMCPLVNDPDAVISTKVLPLREAVVKGDGSRAWGSVPLVMLLAFVVSVVADGAKPTPLVLVQMIDGGATIEQSALTSLRIWYGVKTAMPPDC